MENRNQEIMALLEKYGPDRKRALKENKRLENLYALAELRENLLEWYEFKPEGRLLQVGADYGALTELFARRTASVTVLDPSEESLKVAAFRCRELENVKTVRGSLTAFAGGIKAVPSYDYISIIGTLDPSVSLESQIDAAQSLLAPGGVLLLAACNRFGLKYFAGAKEDAVTVTKRQLTRLLPGGAFYYPMPDYRLPSEIYSDSYLPKKGDLTGALAVYDYPQYLLMDVGAAYDAACEDGQFDNFANSFLVIWKKEG